MLRYWILELTLQDSVREGAEDKHRARRLILNALGALTMIVTAVAVF
jgi:hypothetical protein